MLWAGLPKKNSEDKTPTRMRNKKGTASLHKEYVVLDKTIWKMESTEISKMENRWEELDELVYLMFIWNGCRFHKETGENVYKTYGADRILTDM